MDQERLFHYIIIFGPQKTSGFMILLMIFLVLRCAKPNSNWLSCFLRIWKMVQNSKTAKAKTMRLRIWLIRQTMSLPASLNFSSIYLRRAYSIPLKLTIQCVSFWKTAKFDYNGHVSIMAILCFSGEMTIWGTCDDGAQSSEVSVT